MKENEIPPTSVDDPLSLAEEQLLNWLIASAKRMAESAQAARIEAEAVLQTLRQMEVSQ